MLIYCHFGGQVLAKNCVQLNELLVPNCIWLTDDLIIPVFENNLNLKKIVLNRCSALTSICLQPVITNCKVSQYCKFMFLFLVQFVLFFMLYRYGSAVLVTGPNC